VVEVDAPVTEHLVGLVLTRQMLLPWAAERVLVVTIRSLCLLIFLNNLICSIVLLNSGHLLIWSL
jgi:hypothetical protein